jgi:hypothetical protein
MIRLRDFAIILCLALGLLPAGVGAAPAQQIPLPPGWKQLTWEGVIVSYDPRRYVFNAAKPDDPLARAMATLVESPNPCPPGGADCSPGFARLQLFPGKGMDVRGWVARNRPEMREGVTDLIVADRQAVEWNEEAGVSGFQAEYVVPVGTEMLVIEGSLSRDLVGRLQFSRPAPAGLAVGQTASTTPARAWDLWTKSVGGERVYERPRLYGGTLLTILAMTPRAVMVRTSDDVTGWIQAPAATALTANVITPGERSQFQGNTVVQVELRNGVPLRRGPRSTAPKLLDQLMFGQEAMLLGVRGDWARVAYVDDARRTQVGWARWYYDGARYLSFSVH